MFLDSPNGKLFMVNYLRVLKEPKLRFNLVGEVSEECWHIDSDRQNWFLPKNVELIYQCRPQLASHYSQSSWSHTYLSVNRKTSCFCLHAVRLYALLPVKTLWIRTVQCLRMAAGIQCSNLSLEIEFCSDINHSVAFAVHRKVLKEPWQMCFVLSHKAMLLSNIYVCW